MILWGRVMPECQNTSFTNNDAVISAQGPPDNGSPLVATGICRSSSISLRWTQGDLGRNLRALFQRGLTKPSKMTWGKELGAVWCMAMRVINRTEQRMGQRSGREARLQGRHHWGATSVLQPQKLPPSGERWDWSTIIYINIHLCKLEENWKGACVRMGDMLALSQSTMCRYEKGNEQLRSPWGKKSPAFAAEVLRLDVEAKLPNCTGHEHLMKRMKLTSPLRRDSQ